ncbi:OmpH family outer membrane protein [Geobacter sp. DSM 9736]|uniref:OmpH family outer membrane protein n=1 Tax=Geobacter sp. DSM 9736 TaxID=1277350 RepID=UPI000B611310|nr:OmpH family outer membrane protein [Geobacter sp. DSM 9736]SNB47152.1 periplasmic chaperone for outer membrane proteins Skp [Geobacter sp. DSM 9736]
MQISTKYIAGVLAAILTLPTSVAATEPAIETPSAASSPVPAESVSPGGRIGYVDISRVSRESKQGKAAQTRVKGKADKLKSQLESKQKQLEKQQAALQAKLSTMSQQERVAKAKEFEKKVEEYRKLLQKADNEMKPLQEEAVRSFLKDIKAAAAAYGEAHDYAAIITEKDILYTGAGVVSEDVTDGVIKEMDSSTSRP